MAQLMISLSSNQMLVRATLALACAMFSGAVVAQNLPDPTRPPAAMMAETSASPELIAGPILQSILIAPDRHVAIISGQTVSLNGKFGDQILVKVTETEVVLRNGKEFQTLKLFPDFHKKLSRASSK